MRVTQAKCGWLDRSVGAGWDKPWVSLPLDSTLPPVTRVKPLFNGQSTKLGGGEGSILQWNWGSRRSIKGRGHWECTRAGAFSLAIVGRGGVIISITHIKGSWEGVVTRSTFFRRRVKTENWGSKFLTLVAGGSIESMPSCFALFRSWLFHFLSFKLSRASSMYLWLSIKEIFGMNG